MNGVDDEMQSPGGSSAFLDGPVEKADEPPRACWLCEYNMEPEAKLLSQFICDQAPFMGASQLTRMVHERLVEMNPDAEGCGLDDVKEHIGSHVLTPSVRISNILRALTMLLDRLEGALFTTAEDEAGTTVIDGKNVATYLKVVSEVMQLYKTGDCSKLMFAQNLLVSDKQGEPVAKKPKT